MGVEKSPALTRRAMAVAVAIGRPMVRSTRTMSSSDSAAHDSDHQQEDVALQTTDGCLDVGEDSILMSQGGSDHLVDQVRRAAVDTPHLLVHL